jgi:cAMP phosphodiesterase
MVEKSDNILISHTHLDHIKDLAFLCDNCFGMREVPFQVWSHKTVKGLIQGHLFNNSIWPDFSKLPTEKKPTIQFNELQPEVSIEIGGYKVTPVPVQHPSDAMGYIVEKNGRAILFTLDTAPTEKIWELARELPAIKAIFTEVSFPNKLQNVATLSDHHTPQTLAAEIKKMPPGIPIILTHLKPNFRAELEQEVAELDEPRLQILMKDGMEFNF